MAACVLSPPLVVESVDDCGAAEGLSLGLCESGWLGWVWLEGELGAGEVCAKSSPDPASEIKPSNKENRCTFIMGSNWINHHERLRLRGGIDDPLKSSKSGRSRPTSPYAHVIKHVSSAGDIEAATGFKARVLRLPADCGGNWDGRGYILQAG